MTPAAAPLAALARRPAADPVLRWPGGCMRAGELRARAAALAAGVAAAGPGGPVAVVAEDRIDLVTGLVAALSLGRPVMPLDPARPDFAACLEAMGPGYVLRLAPGATPDWGQSPAADWGQSPPPGWGQSPGLWVATSGTTGPARIAMLPAAALDAHVAASAQVLPRLGPGDCWLVCLPFHTIGALAALWRALGAGASLALLQRFDPDAARALMAAGASHVSVVPAMLEPLAQAGGAPPGALRCLLTGGGALSAAAAETALAAGWPLWQGWGMTETCSHVAAGPVDAGWEPGVVGRPLPGTAIMAEPGGGRLRISGPMVMSGYVQPGAAAGLGLEPDGSFLCTDLGEWLDDGRLRLLGRADEVIVSGGVNIHPEVVEQALAGCPGVDEIGVTGRPDPRWGAVLVAAYAGSATPAQVAAWAREHLPSASRPRGFLQVTRLPRNTMGKLLRRELAEIGLEAETGTPG